MQKEEEGERSDFSRLSVWFRSLLARVGIPVYLAWRTGNESNEGSVSVLIGFWYSCFSGCLWREHATALSAHRNIAMEMITEGGKGSQLSSGNTTPREDVSTAGVCVCVSVSLLLSHPPSESSADLR